MEAFLRSDGALTVGISTKKEYLAAVATPPTTSSGSDLADGRWHSVSICHQAARRPFGQNHLFIYLDGVQRIQAAIKSPAMTDVKISFYSIFFFALFFIFRDFNFLAFR